MSFLINKHSAACTPFDPCKACLIRDFLKEKLPPPKFTRIRREIRVHGFDPNAHQEGCTPALPCSNCRLTTDLRSSLEINNGSDKTDYEAFIELWNSLDLPYDDKPVSDFEFSVRTANCLRNAHITTIGELTRFGEDNLLRLPNFGRRSLNEVKGVLSWINRHLDDHLEAPPD